MVMADLAVIGLGRGPSRDGSGDVNTGLGAKTGGLGGEFTDCLVPGGELTIGLVLGSDLLTCLILGAGGEGIRCGGAGVRRCCKDGFTMPA